MLKGIARGESQAAQSRARAPAAQRLLALGGGSHRGDKASAGSADLQSRRRLSGARGRIAIPLSSKIPVRFLGVALVSLATLVLELTLTRLFSATMFYHFAFLAISLALFGSGASGVFLYVMKPRMDEARTPLLLAASSALFAVATIFGLVVILRHPLNPAAPGLGTLASLAWIYGAAALPFFFSGCVITLAITAWAGQISRLYLFDLAGAAAGCLLLVPTLGLLGAIDTVLSVAVLALLGGLLAERQALAAPARRPRRRARAPEPGDGDARAQRVEGPQRAGGAVLALELLLARDGGAAGGQGPAADLHRLRRGHGDLPRRQRPLEAPRAARPRRGARLPPGRPRQGADHRARRRRGRDHRASERRQGCDGRRAQPAGGAGRHDARSRS